MSQDHNQTSGAAQKILIYISIAVIALLVSAVSYYYVKNSESNLSQGNTNSSTTNTPASESSERFVYLKALSDSVQGPGKLVVSNADGSSQTLIQSLPRYAGTLGDHSVSSTGKIVYSIPGSTETTETLMLSDKGGTPHTLFTFPKGEYVESPVLSDDGEKIAYSLIHTENDMSSEQLWTMNADGTENTLIIENTAQFLEEDGPFRFIPLTWSNDKKFVYLDMTTDSEATPKGMYVADLSAKTIKKVNMPDVRLWGVAFSPDKTKIAYSTFEWKEVEDSFPTSTPPYTLSVTELSTGKTEKILESQTESYGRPVWSPDGKTLLYTVQRDLADGGDRGILNIDVATKETSIVVPHTENTRMFPWAWLSDDRIVYSEEKYTSGEFPEKVTSYLFTIKTDFSDKQLIDSGWDIIVVDTLSQ